MPVHSCGNPLHDVPQWAMFAVPFFAPVYLWVRMKVSALRARKA